MAGQICKSLNKNLFKLLTKQVYNTSITVDRHLYGNKFLLIDGYVEARKKIVFRGMKATFLEKLSVFSKEDSSSLIFTDDLLNMIHLVDNNEEEMNLMISIIKKYSKQNPELRFSTFRFGPVIMRCLHHFEAADHAYSLITDKSLEIFFNQVTTSLIAMDLLWKKKQYEKVLEVFEFLKNQQISGPKFPRETVNLYLAACYKLNTVDSLNRAKMLIKEASEAGAVLGRRAALFAASLAINQNVPEMAMEFLSLIKKENYFIFKNLKIITLAKLNRIAECFEILKTGLDRDLPQSSHFEPANIFEETLDIVKSEIDRRGDNKSDLATLDRLKKCLLEENLLSKQSIDEILCTPIRVRPQPRNDSQPVSGYDSTFNARKDRYQRRPQQTFRSRPELFNPK